MNQPTGATVIFDKPARRAVCQRLYPLSKKVVNANVLIYRLLRATWLMLLLSVTVAITACTSDIRQISQARFLDMVKKREVSQVTIVDDQTVDVRLTTEALNAGKYAGMFDIEDPLKKNKPHVRLTIHSERAFRNELSKTNPDFPILTEKRNWFGFSSQ